MQDWINEASLTGVFRMILIIFFIYTAATFVLRYIIPLLLKNYLQNFHQQNFNQESSGNNSHQKKEGDISVEIIDKNNKQHSSPENDDEYIDYEEVK